MFMKLTRMYISLPDCNSRLCNGECPCISQSEPAFGTYRFFILHENCW